jgi:hypothetical protein
MSRKFLLLIGASVALTVYIGTNLFQIEYLARMDSIEGAYIGISRCLLDHGPQLG